MKKLLLVLCCCAAALTAAGGDNIRKKNMSEKQKEAKKNQKVVELKEIWLSMTIDVGDLNVKAKQAVKFLSAGNKVKVSI